ncbi:acetolactate decarboxylase [Lacticaseibacillus kribbianus]|uniref:acetolactate decarboxylase n=1 Tax=Lacticaseibacillus kribbianus TaxID=2926292 RepID=UPI001CD5F5D2|nr:acetolactate decarboxylase [Lacticaseibacillus kribbianus]
MTTMYQHGTLANLVPGGFEGTMTLGELLTHGDTGIGTLEGLDGELVILDGVVYQVTATGTVNRPDADKTVPFANVHPADFEAVGTFSATGMAEASHRFEKAIASANRFAAVRLTGRFQSVTARAVKAQHAPYPSLVATAADQAVFTREDVEGTLIGYFAPTLYGGMAVPGFHLHFLAATHDFGGHVLDFGAVSGTLGVQTFADVQLHLPDTPAFLARNLDSPDVLDQIATAEGARN